MICENNSEHIVCINLFWNSFCVAIHVVAEIMHSGVQLTKQFSSDPETPQHDRQPSTVAHVLLQSALKLQPVSTCII